MIRLTNVYKSFGPIRALNGLSLEVPAGRVFGLIGPNGAGKTTTIRILSGILLPDAGQISLNGIGLDKPLQARRMLGALIEQPGIYGRLNLLEYLTGQDICTAGVAGALFGAVLSASAILGRNLLGEISRR